MKKMMLLGWLVAFLPAMVVAQEKIDAPIMGRWVYQKMIL
jgi:hypothetical protein